MTIHSFIAGELYADALAAVRAFAENGGAFQNPLILIGPSGVGKSHLLHALAAHVESKQAGAVCFRTVCELTEQYIAHLTRLTDEPFEPIGADVRLLLIDHMEELVGKPQTMTDLSATLNRCMRRGTAVAFSINRSLCNDAFIRDIVSRFENARVVELPLPDREVKTALARVTADELSLSMDDTLLSEVVAAARTAPDLIGILRTLHMRCLADGVAPSVSLLADVLAVSHALFTE